MTFCQYFLYFLASVGLVSAVGSVMAGLLVLYIYITGNSFVDKD